VKRHRELARVHGQQVRDRQNKLREQLQREVDESMVFKWAVELAPSLMMMLSADPQCRILYANKMATEVLGFSARDILGR
jgi:PAS domain-containing protein